MRTNNEQRIMRRKVEASDQQVAEKCVKADFKNMYLPSCIH